LLAFSTAPFCHGVLGSQNQLRAPTPSSKARKPANSVPRSKVKLWRAEDGKGEKVFDDLVHDWARVLAWVLDHPGVAAFALDQVALGARCERTRIDRDSQATPVAEPGRNKKHVATLGLTEAERVHQAT
jgi:hypothetical protein